VSDYDSTLNDWPYCGGANGSIRFDSDLQDSSNSGLAMAVAMLAPCKQKYPLVSWADLIQMSAVASVHTAQGPFIDLAYGREDVPIDIRDMSESQERRFQKKWKPKSVTKVTSEDMLKRNFPRVFPPYPIGEQSAAIHLRVFFNRLGLKAQEGVVLCGGHTLGRAFKDRTGVCPFGSGDQGATIFTKSTAPTESMEIKTGIAGGGSWTKNWLKFDNSYFRRPLEDAQNAQLVWLPTDQALIEDAEFRQYFSLYAHDQDRFFVDFMRAFQKISEFGAKFKFKVHLHSSST
jgi:L-ascorbate peroxidase